MARQSASISSSTRLQLLVRFLLAGLVLLVIVGQSGVDGGSVGGWDDSDAAVDGSDELFEEESSEQDVSSASEKVTISDERQETTTVEPVSAGPEGTTLGYNAVATTPKIVKTVKKLSR
ncbi:aldose 1-epimerase [Anopheles sinensis]|uniref:Aldose 1-epimerase n=1 Tax=Anopheles sinensis TaxID=74873 RepID=A0A084VKH9_ANOSI|nr:aldose 1-epimerase [Anopheles sinensis]